MKIIGNGLLAKSFLKYKIDKKFNCIIFASGVSNSSESDLNNFSKEVDLINQVLSENKNLKLVYFSSIFINRKSPYYEHKTNIENIIKKKSHDFLILRLPQLVGTGGNSNNIFNFFKDKISKDEIISIIKDSERSLIDIDDVRDFVFYALENNISGTLNFSSVEKISVLNLATLMANNLNKNLNYNLLINTEISTIFENNPEINLFLKLKKIEKKGYIQKLIKKYLNNG
jgi:nucleoside-diphosphate-sugar epimerase